MRYLRIILFIFLWTPPASAGEFLSLEITGTGNTDSIWVNLTVTDTTMYPAITDADSLYVLRFAPDHTLLDSVGLTSQDSSANIYKMRDGWYCAHFKAAAPGPLTGTYLVYAAIAIGGDWRGHVAGSYYVQSSSLEAYLAGISSDVDDVALRTDSLKDTTDYYLAGIDLRSDSLKDSIDYYLAGIDLRTDSLKDTIDHYLAQIDLRTDSLKDTLDNYAKIILEVQDSTFKLDTLIQMIQYFLGACDGCVRVYNPNDGTAYKNGYEMWAGTKRFTITFGHSNVPNVLDSTATAKDY